MNPMTPDEVVKVLKDRLSGINYDTCPNMCGLKGNQALQSAISLIQDYQKLRERVSVEKIDKVINYFGICQEFGSEPEDTKNIAQSIVTYLQQPTEH